MTRRGRRRRYDVAFYAPRIAPLLVRGASPAGGAETQILLLAHALAKRGARVCLVVFDLPRTTIPESVGGVAVSVRPPYRARQRLGKLREVLSILRAIAKADAEVVVTRMESPEVGPAALFTKLLGRRFVYSSASLSDFVPDAARGGVSSDPSGRLNGHSGIVPDVDFSRLSLKRRDRQLFRLGLRLADEVVVQTEEQVRLCEAHAGRSPVLIRSVAELVPQGESHPEAFLWIGRVVSSKRPEAFVRLAQSLPEAKFRMVAVPASDRANHVELMTAVERSAATAPNLELLPPRPRDELMDWVNRAVAMVSTSDFEGMPNTFLEGWVRGVPALALAHDPDGVIERHGLGAFAEGSLERFANLASRLWEDRGDQLEVAERCRRYILDYHSPDVISARWLEVLGVHPGVAAAESVVA